MDFTIKTTYSKKLFWERLAFLVYKELAWRLTFIVLIYLFLFLVILNDVRATWGRSIPYTGLFCSAFIIWGVIKAVRVLLPFIKKYRKAKWSIEDKIHFTDDNIITSLNGVATELVWISIRGALVSKKTLLMETSRNTYIFLPLISLTKDQKEFILGKLVEMNLLRAQNFKPKIPVLLNLTAWSFMLLGVGSLISMGIFLFEGNPYFNPNILGIGVFFGLRRLSINWRIFALVIIAFWGVIISSLLIFTVIWHPQGTCSFNVMGKANPLSLSEFMAPIVFAVSLSIIIWNCYILMRESTKLLFYPPQKFPEPKYFKDRKPDQTPLTT